MKIQGIYKIINKTNNKVYIGQSTNIKKRFKEHNFYISNNIKYPLYKAIRKYGLHNFEFIIIEVINDRKELDQKEQYWLDNYQSYLPEKGYNLASTAGSKKNYKVSQETRLKMAKAKKGKKHSEETKNKISKSNKGKHILSEEHKLKLSESHKGKIVSKETREKLSKSHKGKKRKPLSKKHKLNISLGNKNKTLTNEHIKNLKKAWKLRKLKNIFK